MVSQNEGVEDIKKKIKSLALSRENWALIILRYATILDVIPFCNGNSPHQITSSPV